MNRRTLVATASALALSVAVPAAGDLVASTPKPESSCYMQLDVLPSGSWPP